MDQLENLGLISVVAVDQERERYQLAQAPESLTVDEVLNRIRQNGLPLIVDPVSLEQTLILSKLGLENRRVTMSSLIAQLEEEASKE